MEKISFEDFEKVEIRIGTVAKAEIPKWSHWVMRLEVDFGEKEGKKVCFSGIMKFFRPEDLTGKQFPFVVNLEPKKIGPQGELSECMLLLAVPEDKEELPPVLISPQGKVINGTRVY